MEMPRDSREPARAKLQRASSRLQSRRWSSSKFKLLQSPDERSREEREADNKVVRGVDLSGSEGRWMTAFLQT